jgi:hypothetical protein
MIPIIPIGQVRIFGGGAGGGVKQTGEGSGGGMVTAIGESAFRT